MKWLLAFVSFTLLLSCSRIENKKADAIDAFITGGFDTVTVYSIQSRYRDLPEGVEDNEAYFKQVGDDHFHQYPINSFRLLTKNDEGLEVIKAVTKGMRTQADAAKCFDPHHAIRIQKGSEYFDIIICYGCELVQIWSPMVSDKYSTTSSASQETLDRVLKTATKVSAK